MRLCLFTSLVTVRLKVMSVQMSWPGKGMSSPLLSEPPISFSLNVSGLKIKWLKERHSEDWVAHTRYKSTEWPSDEVVD
jgi:hypothetical protein